MHYTMYLGSASATSNFQPLGTLTSNFQPLGTLASNFQPLGTLLIAMLYHFFGERGIFNQKSPLLGAQWGISDRLYKP